MTIACADGNGGSESRLNNSNAPLNSEWSPGAPAVEGMSGSRFDEGQARR